MIKKRTIEFVESKTPIREAVTKFGGQPVWIDLPQWPLSGMTHQPMRFICQIAVDPDLFGPTVTRMAYIFMTDDESVDGTWEPDGGENAVILQPGNPTIPVSPLTTGPTLYRIVKKMLRSRLVPEPCEYCVNSLLCDDRDFVPEHERSEWSDDEGEDYAGVGGGNKIGGAPSFIQNDEFPRPGDWKLLLQLDSTLVPFFINLGDAGVGYAFLSADGRSGKFLWQCC
jgi:uncharacterized protein YwqG